MRVLVMYSWDDDISEMRWHRNTSDPELAHFEIAQCFALPSEGAAVHGPSVARRLATAIEDFQPDVVLIHTGAAFRRSPSAFVECVQLVKAKYANLRLGYERRSRGFPAFEELNAFETSPEIADIERRFFGG